MIDYFSSLADSFSKSGRLRGASVDWLLFGAIIPLLCAGLVTMNSFAGDNFIFQKQLISISVAVIIFFLFSFIDFRFLRRTSIVVTLYTLVCGLLTLLFILGHVSKGAQSWFRFGVFGFEPSDIAKLILILVMAKYFSRRHIEIANIRHIIVSGFYAGFLCLLVLLQPDLGLAAIIFLVWFGMTLVSGLSPRHTLLVVAIIALSFLVLWFFGLKEYQKERVRNFINPLANVRSTGYNAFQSMVATGSGEFFGKGIGYGTQSRLSFLPEYQTDFIFSAFAEEWGFFGVMLLFALWAIVIWRVLANAYLGATNFEVLFGMGMAVLLMAHFIIHVGMNIGVLPVTGIPLPFMSYGGSHLLAEFGGLGILMGMRRYRRDAHREVMKNEFSGL